MRPDFLIKLIFGFLEEKLKSYFRPEFINRLDEIILFSSLDKNTLTQIARGHAKKLTDRVKEVGYRLTVDESVLLYLAQKSEESGFGARPLARLWVEEVETPLSRLIVEESIEEDTLIQVKYDEASESVSFLYAKTKDARAVEQMVIK